jgi:hypothetical protein
MKNFIEECEMGNKWLKQLKDYEDTVNFEENPKSKENCLFSPSPSFNWIFACPGGGFPRGTGLLFSAEPKAGKSLMCQAIISQLHQDDPDAIVLYWNTELRGSYQQSFFDGIDRDRLIMYDTNLPEDIFDRLTKDIFPLVEEGMPVKMVVIDSLTNIAGRRGKDCESVLDLTPGDRAATKQSGLERIIPFLKKHKITLLSTEQKRSNLEMGNPHAPKTKSTATWYTKHAYEYFIEIKKETAKDQRTDLLGNTFTDETVKSMKSGEGDVTGHRISFRMEASSLGTPNRQGILTIDYKSGIKNTHEEVFELGKNTGVIAFKMPRSYSYGEYKWSSKEEILTAIRDNKELYDSILREVIARDSDK